MEDTWGHLRPQWLKIVQTKIKTIERFELSFCIATTCVRVAYKAFQMSFPYSFGNLYRTNGLILLMEQFLWSQKRFSNMMKRIKSPSYKYQFCKCHKYYEIIKKHFYFWCTDWLTKWENMPDECVSLSFQLILVQLTNKNITWYYWPTDNN